MKRVMFLAVLAVLAGIGCANRAVQAPVPGTINTFDAFAARSIGDAQTALLSAKTWEQCSDQSFPASVTFDNQTFQCDATAGAFPPAGRTPLFRAEQLYNTALAAAQAYHAGVTANTTDLSAAVTQLGIAIGEMFSSIGKNR